MAHTDIPKLMRTAMLDNTAVASVVDYRVFYQVTDGVDVLPYVWFTRTAEANEDDLEGGDGISEITFAVEIMSDRSIDSLIDGVKQALKGMIGESDIQYVDIENFDDDYGFRSADEAAEYMTALRVIVYV
jgi:hypothetical protein